MAQAGTANSESKDEEIASLEQSLHEWRYILLHVDRWLRWEDQNQPVIMAAAVTAFFLMLCTDNHLIARHGRLFSYLGPTVFHSYICPPAEWTAEHQRQYQQVCMSLIRTKDALMHSYQCLKTMKEEKPKQYFILVIAVLAVIAFIGNLIPNICLVYFLAVFLVLLPGLHQRGLLAQAYAASLQVVVNLLKQTKKKD
ncbi:ADP-ribosylation factor-like protein 6-interacting protein 1 [Acanthaster planci]|uniref:ADP-ribosylation factor-like protein 6-interacting protein 1 n=1 Tax=Acanthaster planci TaxID=133434 RepID=A0A8B7YJV5_ACAPL|nr:ADP-ribosylation factor-like protein 6-interacting protein 1 [Acanthaster planci]